MAPAVFTLKHLTLGYRRRAVIDHLDGVIEAGSLVAIAGPNGSGKSTLLKALAGLLRPLSGEIVRHAETGGRLAYLPQQSEIDRSFPASVEDLVSLGLWHRVGLFGRIGAAERAAIRTALESVGLAGAERRALDTLSGGQMQRALFARVLVQDAPVILLDEPFSAIDNSTVNDLMDAIEGWHKQGRTVLAVLHDLDLIKARFPETLLLGGEAPVWDRTKNVLSAANLELGRERFVPAGDRSAAA